MVGVPDGVGWAGALQDVVGGLAPGALPAGPRAELTGRAGVDAVALGAHLAAPALLVARAAGLAGPVELSPFSDLIHNESESYIRSNANFYRT